MNMKCPNCNETLLMTERNSIEIDYCPACRGVWLDKGELDKMLEYAASKPDITKEAPGNYRDKEHDGDRKKYDQYGRPYKKKSFLGDLFDFD